MWEGLPLVRRVVEKLGQMVEGMAQIREGS